MLLLPPASTILNGPLDVTTELLPDQNALLPVTPEESAQVSAPDLAPSIFSARELNR